MTKKLSKEKLMNSVMTELGEKLESVLENYGTSEGKAHVNEMARSASNRAVDPKALANVRDAAQRRHYDENWAKSATPLPKYSDLELLHRYVAALLLFGCPCPQTEEDIDKIGIFANYAHALLDGSGTLEDIQLLYSKNDKIVARDRKGSKRAIKGWRDEDNKPSANFDFDKEEDKSQEPAQEPEQPTTDKKPYPDYDDVNIDDEPQNEPSKAEEEKIADDVEKDVEKAEEIAAKDDAAAGESTQAQGPANKGQIDADWESLNDITYEQYYDPAYNRAFSQINDDYIFWDQKNNLIGMEMSIEDRDTGESRDFKIWGPSFGKMLERFDIATEASIQNMTEKFWKVKTLPVNIRFWKAWRKNAIPSDEIEDQLEDNIDDFYFKHLGNCKDIDQVVKCVQEMDY